MSDIIETASAAILKVYLDGGEIHFSEVPEVFADELQECGLIKQCRQNYIITKRGKGCAESLIDDFLY